MFTTVNFRVLHTSTTTTTVGPRPPTPVVPRTPPPASALRTSSAANMDGSQTLALRTAVVPRAGLWAQCRRRERKDTLSQARLDLLRGAMFGLPWQLGQSGPGCQMPSPLQQMQHAMMGMPMQQAMGTMGMYPNMHMQQNFHTPSEPQAPRVSLTAKSDGSLEVVSITTRPKMLDDDRKLSTSYTSLGVVWMHGEKRTTPRVFRRRCARRATMTNTRW